MTLCPDPELAARLLRGWCPAGTAIRIEGSERAGRAVNLRVDLVGVPAAMPIGIQVSDLLGRELDRTGAVRLRARETVSQLIAHLALRLHGDGAALRVAPQAASMTAHLYRVRRSGP
ncbi:hypothetical protein [Luteibacter yeojuensis]|uniref:Uncharacterized protein n=1 Tax=Luteibacter yeojuensis TaxID=345309 RepID=A0A0F3L3N4_9GAMM|nr:hypothetical protein [Luteibacter yeojuensis]KJV36969.1 hypothetical protein VI08_01890 [Luteibacter yeojuensis]